jgi:hypothetical protein
LFSGTVQNIEPFFDGRPGPLSVPTLTNVTGFGQTESRRITIDLGDDGSDHRQAALVDLFVRSHLACQSKVSDLVPAFKPGINPRDLCLLPVRDEGADPPQGTGGADFFSEVNRVTKWNFPRPVG